MTSRSVRDGVSLVSGFHFFMATMILLGTAAIYVYAILPPAQGIENGATRNLFLPYAGIVIGLILCIMYVYVGIGLNRLKNSARMTAIFLSALGLTSGFIGVLASIFASAFGNPNPNWLSVGLLGVGTICFYAVIAMLDIFILFFLFNKKVREAFYTEELLAANAEEDDLTQEGQS